MKKITILFLTMSILASILFVGCSDDDDNPVGSSLKPLFIFGGVYVDNGRLAGHFEFWDATASGKRVDSAKFGDNITMTDFESKYWAADDNYYGKSIYYYYDSGYVSGDTLNIKIYDDGTIADFDLVLFDRIVDSVTFVTEPTFPVSLNSSNNLVWTSHPMADFYTISFYHYWYDTQGTERSLSKAYTTTDTTFSIPIEFTAHNGELSYQISPYSGNKPTAEGVIEPNVSTSTMSGNIWTYGNWIYKYGDVGAGLTAPLKSPKLDTEREIIKLNHDLILGR